MTELTPEAKIRFDRYLERMRSALRGTRAVEPLEIEQNVREHVELALAGAPAPVGAERLEHVLEQLGPLDRWISDDERPWWNRALRRVSAGPEDWRLAYLAFGIFALGLLTLPIGIGVCFLLCASLVSRGEVELLAERGEPLGPRRWRVLPAIWLRFAAVSAAILISMIVPAAAVGLNSDALHLVTDTPEATPDTLERTRIEIGFLALSAGTWWLILAAIFAVIVKSFRTLFLPVTAGLGRKHAAILALVGAMLASFGAVLLFVIR
jgi:hypothetical protein